MVLLLFKIMNKRIKSYQKTKVLRLEVMTGNSSSAVTNAPPVTMRRGKKARSCGARRRPRHRRPLPAVPPSECGGSSCEQLQTAIRHCFPVTSTVEGLPRSNLMPLILPSFPPVSGSGSGSRSLLGHRRVQLKGKVEAEFTRKHSRSR